MKFIRELSSGHTIRRVTDAGIEIGKKTFVGPVALTAEKIMDEWPNREIAALVEADFEPLLDLSPDLILLGTGASNIFPPRELVFAMARRGVGFEVMDTYAAARTFNVLLGEERRAAAVLYL